MPTVSKSGKPMGYNKEMTMPRIKMPHEYILGMIAGKKKKTKKGNSHASRKTYSS